MRTNSIAGSWERPLRNIGLLMKTVVALAMSFVLFAAVADVREVKVSGRTGRDIQAAIDGLAHAGGGRVIVPAGDYHTGSIRLRGNVELHLEKDARLLGGTKSEDYDDFPDSVCTVHPEGSSKVFVYAWDETNVAITGEGTIDGQGPKFFDTSAPSGHYPKPPIERPLQVELVQCKNVKLQGVTFKDSPCWTMLIRLCENIEVDGITVTGDQRMINNDGIDFDGCRHIRVANSYFKTGDDCLILRAMREIGKQQHIVCEDVIVSNCVLSSTCQSIRLGCPSDDTIRHALFTHIKSEGSNNGIFADYPTRYLRPDDEGFMDISDIRIEHYSGTHSGSALQIVSQPGVKVRNVDGIMVSDFNVRSARPLRFIGNRGYEIKNVVLENANIDVKGNQVSYEAKGCDNLVFRNVTFNGKRVADGRVNAAPGSDEPLKRGPVISWEAKRGK